MSLTADAIRLLAAKGLSVEDIALVAEANAAPLASVETSAERRRRLDRERKAAVRASAKSADKGGQNADSKTDAVSAKSAEMSAKSADKCGHPRARVKDNLLTTEVPTVTTTAEARDESDWPEVEPGHLAKLLASLAGPGLGEITKHPSLTTSSGEIVRWKQAGCSWSLDVVPTIQGRTMLQRRTPILTWGLLTSDVLTAKSARTAPLPDNVAPIRPDQPRALSSWGQQEADLRAATERLKEKYRDAV